MSGDPVSDKLTAIIRQVERCDICAQYLPNPPRPVFSASSSASILVAGQAPGRLAHETGIPFNDPSGDRLRDWMGIDRDTFYDVNRIALVPMAFCYPGTGTSGDLPPRKECADTWRQQILDAMPSISLTLLVGSYSVAWHLAHEKPDRGKRSLTEAVRDWRRYAPAVIPMPHPSPRNNLWLRRNPWFEEELVPYMRERVGSVLGR
jgi:uracil-DNA glycosylase